MKKLQFNKPVAILVVLLVVSISSFVKSQSTFAGFYNRANEVYMNGYNESGYSIHNDCLKKVSTAKNLMSVANKYLKNDDPTVSALNHATLAFDHEQSIQEEAKASLLLDDVFNQLILKLEDIELSLKDRDYVISFKADYESRNDMIERNEYHDYVLSLLDETKSFPASVLYQLSNKKLEVFNGEIE